MTDVLARRDRALTPDETEALLRDRLGDGGVLRSTLEFGVFTVWLAQSAWHEAVLRCRDEPLLAYDMFDNLFGVDARDEGFDVVAILYSTSTGNRLVLRTRCDGGREAPTCPSVTDVYRGADWMERETYDMFGIVFDGHPALEPRILTVENFEGWPLRKDFPLASRVAKPWPGVKEPAELDEDGNVIERAPKLGDAPGPYELDKAIAEQAKRANPLPEPDTLEGAQVEAGAEQADVAADSDNVVAGETEQALEDDQKLTAEADVEVAGDTADDAGDALAEHAGRDEPTDARQRAEERRKQQAEARRRKAEERAGETGATPAAEHTDDADLPSGQDSGAKAGTAGGEHDTPAADSPRDPADLERPETGDLGSQTSHEVEADPVAEAGADADLGTDADAGADAAGGSDDDDAARDTTDDDAARDATDDERRDDA